MNKPAVTPPPVAKTLAEQKSDFTAEGSPPPGMVSNAIPVGAPDSGAESPRPATARRAIKLKRARVAAIP
jgi:hypothetical protein